MKMLKQFANTKQSFLFCIFASLLTLQTTLASVEENTETSKLENEWSANCKIKNGWGDSGHQSYCFLTWQSLQDISQKGNSNAHQKNKEDLEETNEFL